MRDPAVNALAVASYERYYRGGRVKNIQKGLRLIVKSKNPKSHSCRT